MSLHSKEKYGVPMYIYFKCLFYMVALVSLFCFISPFIHVSYLVTWHPLLCTSIFVLEPYIIIFVSFMVIKQWLCLIPEQPGSSFWLYFNFYFIIVPLRSLLCYSTVIMAVIFVIVSDLHNYSMKWNFISTCTRCFKMFNLYLINLMCQDVTIPSDTVEPL